MNIQPAQYHRNSKNWHKLLGKTGTILFSTRLDVTSKELEDFLPYCFLIVELDPVLKDGQKQKIEIMGEAKTLFTVGEKVRLELRKSAIPDEKSIIPYGLKACKLA